MNNSNYNLANQNLTIEDSDPVNCCLDGSYLNCTDNPWKNKHTICPDYMAQRCARNFDNVCDIYLTQLDSKDINATSSAEFIKKVAEAKYCRLDTSDPEAQCVTYCEQVNPNAPPGSATYCSTVGAKVFRDSNELYAISTDFAQTAKLDSTAPLKSGKCPLTCDILNLNDFSNDDRVLNECLTRGTCQEVMMDLSQNIVKNNIQITNDKLKEFINQYIVTNKQNQLSQANQLGGAGPQITNVKTTVPGPSVNLQDLNPVPPSGFINASNANKKEGFNFMNDVNYERGATMANNNEYATLKQNIKLVQQIGGLLVGVLILVYLYNKNNKSLNVTRLDRNGQLLIFVAFVSIVFSVLKFLNKI